MLLRLLFQPPGLSFAVPMALHGRKSDRNWLLVGFIHMFNQLPGPGKRRLSRTRASPYSRLCEEL
jgi:hypothetical protein